MAARSGDQHHTRVRTAQDKAKFLDLVKSGMDTQVALRTVKKADRTFRDWLADSRFAADLELAVAEGKALLVSASRVEGGIDYQTLSEEFLGLKVFPHHLSWIDVLEGRKPSWLHESMTYEPGNPNRLLVNVPPEHAKSTVLTVGYATYRIAMDPNVRIVIVSQTQTRAKEFLYSIKQRLTEEAWVKLQQVFGPAEGWQATSDQWSQDRIYLKRTSGEKDPTVQAIGMGQQIYGTRADLIILDDVVTTTNAHEWEKQLNWLQKMVITRLGKNGKLLIAGTRVASNDLYRELRNPDHWSGGNVPFTVLAMPAVLESYEDPKDWVTLWPKSDHPWDGDEDLPADEDGLYPKWDGPTLSMRRSEVAPSTWALVYQQQDVEEDAIFPPAVIMESINRGRSCGPLMLGQRGHPTGGEWLTIMGLDPAMTGKTAAVMYAVERNTGERLVLDVYNMIDPTPGKIRSLIEDWVQRYRPIEVRIEINAFQKAFALDEDLRQWLANQGVRFSEHFTGKNKWDTSFGVASMSMLFGSMRDGKAQGDGLLELPANNNEHVRALINQLITWKADTKGPTDCVMALWFCEIRARELVSQNNFRTTHVNNPFATMRNRANQGLVNLDDLAYEQNIIYM
jgi:hypothetical protein